MLTRKCAVLIHFIINNKHPSQTSMQHNIFTFIISANPLSQAVKYSNKPSHLSIKDNFIKPLTLKDEILNGNRYTSPRDTFFDNPTKKKSVSKMYLQCPTFLTRKFFFKKAQTQV